MIKDLEGLINRFEIDIAILKQEIVEKTQTIKEKQQFLTNIKKRIEVKNSQLYYALENDLLTYWSCKEVSFETRNGSFIEVKINKKYFFNTEQVAIIHQYLQKKYLKIENDIRITQFF